MKLYAVTLAHITKPEDMRFLTVSDNKNDCVKYINKKLLIDNKEHFTAWCNLRGLNPSDNSSWVKYANITNLDTSRYAVRKLKYNAKAMAMILRMLNGCVPLGCGYESREEYALFLESLPEEKLQEIGNRLDKLESKGE